MEKKISSEHLEALKAEFEETKAKIDEINRVEGFNPSLLVTCYSTGAEDRLYLQAEPAMVWFRLKYPKGRLEQLATRINDNMATIEGRVYDDEGNLLANAFVTRYRNDSDSYGKDYVQNAGTSAIRKALGNCGFGTPYNAQYIEGITERVDMATNTTAEPPVDSGRTTGKFTVPGVNAAKKVLSPAAPVPDETAGNQTANDTQEPVSSNEQAPEPAHEMPEKTAQATIPVPTPAKKRGRPKKVEEAPVKDAAPTQTADIDESAVQTATEGMEQRLDAQPNMEHKEPSDIGPAEPSQPETTSGEDEAEFASALAFTVPNGRYAGKTFKELLDSGEKSVIAYFLKPLYAGQPSQAAALIIAKHCPLN